MRKTLVFILLGLVTIALSGIIVLNQLAYNSIINSVNEEEDQERKLEEAVDDSIMEVERVQRSAEPKKKTNTDKKPEKEGKQEK